MSLGVDVKSRLSRVIVSDLSLFIKLWACLTTHPFDFFSFLVYEVELIHALWDALRINLLAKPTMQSYEDCT